MKPYLFIANPTSGTKAKTKVIQMIHERFPADSFDLALTAYPGHATELATEAARVGRKIVVAIGGDGTLNEVGSGLVHTETAMAMIPMGSGNGFARHFKIPMNPGRALDAIPSGKELIIDTLKLDNSFFLNVAGLGFDAKIAHVFSTMPSRGLISYVKVALKCFSSFEPVDCLFDFPHSKVQERVLLVSFANASQYGNQAQIAPGALTQDGLFETCILKPFPLWAAPSIAIRLFTGTIRKSKYYLALKSNHLIVSLGAHSKIHLDGEPRQAGPTIKITIQPQSLKIIVPS